METLSKSEAQAAIDRFEEVFQRIASRISQTIVGHRKIIEDVLIAFFCGGHVLLEGLPGLGKTSLIHTLAGAMSVDYSRIQCTPDLMPADIIGTRIFVEGQKEIRFEKGPVFANVVLADEINRATPKTQASLLEAMQECQVTVADTTHALPDPFLVMATQNPIEMEGTYPLPEAQLDRFFFKLEVSFPDLAQLVEIAARTTQGESAAIATEADRETILEMKRIVPWVAIADYLLEYAARLVLATHSREKFAPPLVQRYVKYGASPRAMQTLVLGAKAKALCQGRAHASSEDIQSIALSALRHRLILNFEAEADGIRAADIICQVVDNIR